MQILATFLLLCVWWFNHLLANAENKVTNTQYRDYLANAGSTVILTCDKTHDDYDSVTWWRNNSNSFVAKQGPKLKEFNKNYTGRLNFQRKDLVISNCQGSDDGFYYCETKFKEKILRGGYARFIVEEQPKCSDAVSVITALRDTSAFLPCDVRGRPSPVYEWKKKVNEQLITLGSRFEATQKGLTIHKVSEDDAGTYQVKLKNSVKTVYSSINLYIKSRHSPSIQWRNATEMSHVVLDCDGTAKEKKLGNIKWINTLGNDATLSNGFNILKNGSLSVEKVVKTFTGFYTCKERKETDFGTMTKSYLIYLNVQYRPYILAAETSVKGYENSHVLLPCSAKGNPKQTNRWMFPNGTIISNNEKFHSFSNGSLLVRNIRLSDVMNYTCAPFNMIGAAEYRYTQILVFVFPYFRRIGAESLRVNEGEEVKFMCAAFGTPKPNVTWHFLNGSVDGSRATIEPSGLVRIKDAQLTDAGVYSCKAQSSIGKSNLNTQVIVVGKPLTPIEFSIRTMNNAIHFSWQPSYGGGLKQYFELWYRDLRKTDYDWLVIIASTNYYKALYDELNVGESFYSSLRAINKEGSSDFTYVIRAQNLKGITRSALYLDSLSDIPLSPYELIVNISSRGYDLNWKYMETPGRPAAERFIIEYREKNASEWREFVGNGRAKRSLSSSYAADTSISIAANDIPNVNHPLDFQVSSVTSTNIRSEPTSPKVYNTANPAGVIPLKDRKGGRADVSGLVIIIVVGIVCALFVILLAISAYCICRRVKKGSRVNNEKETLVPTENNNVVPDHNSIVLTDSSTFLVPKIEVDSPKRYHVRTCPALKLGECSGSTDRRQPDDVYVLIEPHSEEKVVCTCNKKYVPLHDQQKKLSKKKRFHRSSSLPSILLTSDADLSSADPSEFLDDEEYEVSDLEKGSLQKLDKDPLSSLKKGKFRDSYDKFCRSETDASRNVDNKTKKIEAKTLKAVNVNEVNSRPPKDNPSNEKSVPPENGTDRSDDTKSISKKSIEFNDADSSASDPDSMIEYFPKKTAVKNEINANCKNDNSKRDTGYCSDNAPIIFPISNDNKRYGSLNRYPKTNKPIKSLNYFSEDEGVGHGSPYRPLKPPTYRQAIMDIKRLSENNEVTDSEEWCKELVQLGRKMGVRLDDSLENDVNKTLPITKERQYSKYNKPYIDTGYMSDIQDSVSRSRYSDREKSMRCAQLLSEFKSSQLPMADTMIPEEVSAVGAPLGISSYPMENSISNDLEDQSNRHRGRSEGADADISEWLV